MIGPLDKGRSVFAVDVGKMFGLHNEPDSFYGIKVRGVGRKIERFEEVPVEVLPFVPGGVVEDEKVPLPGRDDRTGSLIKEDLEDIRIAVACFNGEELSRSGTDGPQDIEADMIAVVDDPRI